MTHESFNQGCKMKNLKLLAASAAMAVGVIAAPASASLYTNSFGTVQAGPSDCDDCFSGPVSFGAGQSINYFGTVYTGLYVSSNGYVTFGAGSGSFTTAPLNTETIGPMIAGSYNDLDSRNDALSQVSVNDSTLGQLVVTWFDMGHFPQNYNVRSTFQLVIRSDQFAVPTGEGQLGFFYGDITDPNSTSAGFGDGHAEINPGEVAFASIVPGTTLSNNDPRFYNLTGGAPVIVPPAAGVPEPTLLALLGLGASGMALSRRRRSK